MTLPTHSADVVSRFRTAAQLCQVHQIRSRWLMVVERRVLGFDVPTRLEAQHDPKPWPLMHHAALTSISSERIFGARLCPKSNFQSAKRTNDREKELEDL